MKVKRRHAEMNGKKLFGEVHNLQSVTSISKLRRMRTTKHSTHGRDSKFAQKFVGTRQEKMTLRKLVVGGIIMLEWSWRNSA
jgi:hypothetical protein